MKKIAIRNSRGEFVVTDLGNALAPDPQPNMLIPYYDPESGQVFQGTVIKFVNVPRTKGKL